MTDFAEGCVLVPAGSKTGWLGTFVLEDKSFCAAGPIRETLNVAVCQRASES